MSVQSTTDAGRSLLGNALHWALPRLAIYVFGSLGAMLAFIAWAFVYTYVWPGKPPAVSIETPTPPPVVVPDAPPRATPIEDKNSPLISTGPVTPDLAARVPTSKVPREVEAISQIPSDVLPSLRNTDIYLSDAKVGQIKDVLVSYDGTLVGYIVGVDDRFLGDQGKDIAVPSEAVGFTMRSGRFARVLYMTKDAVKSAPKQKFDNYKMRWVPDTAP
jgi:PRC-barrel domain